MTLYLVCIFLGLLAGSVFKKKNLPRKKVILYTAAILAVFNVFFAMYAICKYY